MEEIERHPAQLESRPRAPPPPPPPLPPPISTTTEAHAQASVQGSVLQSNSASSSGGGDASMGDVLLGKRWAIHWMSRMYHFQRHELSTYAHDLVKFLRDDSLVAFKREFGYKVSIRHTDAFVAFEVLEERDPGDVNMEPLKQFPAMNQSQLPLVAFGVGGSRLRSQTAESAASAAALTPRPSFRLEGTRSPPVDGAAGSDPRRRAGSAARRDEQETKDAGDSTAALRQRKGGFVLYFPTEEEDEQQQRQSMSQRKTKERQYVVLLRGNEQLLGSACAWLQTRFQCIVSEREVRISPVNLKWLARSWIVDSLARGERVEQEEQPEKAKQPLLLKYRNLDEQSMVRQYTLTVPWATLRRLCEQSKQASDFPNTVTPELIQMTEEMYFETLPLNMAAFELDSVEMAEVAVDQTGRIELNDMSLVHPVLRALAELLSIQNVPGPAKPVMTL